MPIRLSELDIPRESLSTIVEPLFKNFNSDRRREFRREHELRLATIKSAWQETGSREHAVVS